MKFPLEPSQKLDLGVLDIDPGVLVLTDSAELGQIGNFGLNELGGDKDADDADQLEGAILHVLELGCVSVEVVHC